ncbi:MAG: hypothetical protein J7K68_03090 [Candidatus Diapherotrites archaeon]|nr:hypothetical protein [Candidatus Diapherotrites archaeon]
MFEMTGILREGKDGGYIVKAPETPVILLDKKHGPTQQYLKAYGRSLIGKRVNIYIIEQRENFWIAQISPEELKNKGFGRVQERR